MPTPRRTPADLANEASFIFQGDVLQIGASTLPELTAGVRSAIVRVTRVLLSTPLLADASGTVLTVELAPREQVRQGRSYEFYTHPRAFGGSVIVTSLGHRAVKADVVAAAPSDPVRAREIREMRKHVDDADVIVTGIVSAVRLIATPKAVPHTDKDPKWREAVIDVAETFKGDVPAAAELIVLFSASRHPGWRETPELEVGQRGVFLVHSIAPEEAGGSTAAYACLHSWDVQPWERVDDTREQLRLSEA